MSAIKGTSRRVWITDADLQLLQQISDHTNLGQTELLSQMIHAAVRSISENGNRATFPLRFAILKETDQTQYSLAAERPGNHITTRK